LPLRAMAIAPALDFCCRQGRAPTAEQPHMWAHICTHIKPHIKPPPYLPSNPPQLVGFNVRFDVYLMTLHRAGLHVYLIDTSGQKPSPVSFPFHRPLVIQSPKLFTVLVKLWAPGENPTNIFLINLWRFYDSTYQHLRVPMGFFI